MMSSRMFSRTANLLAIFPLLLMLAACGGGGTSTNNGDPGHKGSPGGGSSTDELPEGSPLAGSVQKGPFQAGAKVTIVVLKNGVVDANADVLETTVDERGGYAFSGTAIDGPAMLTVSGYWFDENSGQYSGEPVTLQAVVNVDDGVANINVLTDLISARLQQALAEHSDDYPAALASVMEEYRELTGLKRPPGSLDMLKGFIQGETLDLPYYQETRLLPLISAAVAENALPNLVAAREGFAISGAQNEEAQAFWDAMWEGYAELLEDHDDENALMAHLQAVLSEQYPFGDNETFPPSLLGGLQSVLVGNAPSCSQGDNGSNDRYNRRICPGREGEILHYLGVEYTEAGFYLEAPAAGSYVVRVEPQQPINNDNKIVLEYWGLSASSTQVRERCETYGGNCSVATSAMREGDRAYFRVRNSEQQSIRVLAYRLGDGHPQRPMIIDPANVPHYGRAGSRDGSSVSVMEYSPTAYINSYAHYLFYVKSVGGRLVVDQFLCGDEILPAAHSMEILLAKVGKSGYTTVKTSSVRSCDGFSHDIGADETGVYYLRVHPDYIRTTGVQPSSASYDFRVRLLPR